MELLAPSKAGGMERTAKIARLDQEAKSGGLPGPLKTGQLMHSTASKTAKRDWVQLTKVVQQRDAARSYCSTDGSSTGWHSAVFVRAGENTDKVHLRTKYGDMKGSRNVGAEASGFLLGVQTLSKYEKMWGNCVFLADFLNALAWDCGGAKYNHEVLIAAYRQVEGIKTEMQAKGMGGTEGWDRIHHPGHQVDNSW